MRGFAFVLLLCVACGDSDDGGAAGAGGGGSSARGGTGGDSTSGGTGGGGGDGVSDASVGDAMVAVDAAIDAALTDSATDEDDAGYERDSTCPPLVVLDFAGEVATVSMSPLGLGDGVRTTAVRGSLRYDPCIGDAKAGDSERGEYDHAGAETGAFRIEVGGLVVRGSKRPVLEVENLSSDTFRFRDGPQFADSTPRVMMVDGVPKADVELLIAITDGTGNAWSSDGLPTTFPLDDSHPHTFSVKDDGGTLLMQLSSLTQR